ncbi:MAG: hypothetical protein GY847_17250 [Proteobacteria bacterium]|nr:hypothetical protein [Pseudomonadota bacterium]
MAEIRICTYNGEWLDEMFDNDNELDLVGDGSRTGRSKAERLAATKTVLRNVNADLIGIVEGPGTSSNKSTVKCLEHLAEIAEIDTNKALIGFPSPGNQELAILYNPEKLEVVHSPGGTENKRSNPQFNERFYFDTDDDTIKEEYKFYRPPLEAEVKVKETGLNFNVMVVHTKSKGIFASMDLFHRQRKNESNRRKLFAECAWIRNRVDEWIDAGKDVMVMGDFNDGPEMDFYEFQFGRSAVETVIGDLFEPERILRAYTGRPKWTRNGWSPSTASFKDPMSSRRWVNALIDHILVTPGLPVSGERQDNRDAHKIWNPFLNEKSPHFISTAKEIKDAVLFASDHFPVSLDLKIS